MRAARVLQVVLVLALLAGLGGTAAWGIAGTLAISTEPVDGVPVEDLRAAPARPHVPPPMITVASAPTDRRTQVALRELESALAEAPGTRGTATLRVTAGDGEDTSDTYRLSGSAQDLRVVGESTTGAVRGIYDLAARVRAGRPVAQGLGQEVTSRLPFRMVDLGAAGVDADPEQWASGDDYSHISRAFERVILPEAPYVDTAALAEARASVLAHAEHVLAAGYNAIAVPGFLEYVAFDGLDVYGEDDDHPARAAAMREAFGPIWRELDELGLAVHLRTDMLALSTPLAAYLEDRFGTDTEDPELWEVYAEGLREVYAAMPWLAGVVIRIGEAGPVYDLPEWDYSSALEVRTVPAVRAMLEALTAVGEESGTDVVFRSWSVGVGAVGDLHTKPASYAEVLDGLDSERLVVSTKYTLGDFYSHLPLNHTLESGEHRRIVELQSRREFEVFGSIPNDLGVVHQQALQHFLAANPRVEGIWTWTQDGGPWRAGPMSLLLTSGFWQLYDLNTQVAARLARDPDVDVAEVTAGWARRWFSDSPTTVAVIGEVMAASREAVRTGLYIGPYADLRVRALGLEPPPMMWIFEWDILTGDSAVLDIIHAVSRDRLDEAIAEGAQAVRTATRMRDQLAATDPATWHDPELRAAFLDSLEFQVDLFELLDAYRRMVLLHGRWLDTGQGREEWAAARDRFTAVAANHERTYAGDLDHPAFNLTAARIGMERAERDPLMSWLARIGLVALGGWLVVGVVRRRGAARALLAAALRPWRAAEAVAGLTRGQRTAVVVVPLLALVGSRLVLTWFAAPTHLLVTGLGWLALIAVAGFAVRRRDPWPVIAAVGGAVLLRCLLLLAVLAPRGPGGYWYAFWTEPGVRTAYLVVAAVGWGWVLAALVWALAPQVGRRRAAAALLAVLGLGASAVGGLLAVVGLEQALTAWNDQMSLLPWGLSRILGITVHLGIPTDLPFVVLGTGAVLLALAAALALARRNTRGAAGVLPS